MSDNFLPTWLYQDEKIFEFELDKYSKNYWHPLIFVGEIKPGEILERKFFNQSLFIDFLIFIKTIKVVFTGKGSDPIY